VSGLDQRRASDVTGEDVARKIEEVLTRLLARSGAIFGGAVKA
jgi:hypothetical protein